MVLDKNIPIYNVEFSLGDQNNGAKVISLVKDPAAEVDFLKFDKVNPISLSLNSEKRIITGVALRADYPIYRESNGEKFYIKFTPQVIERIVLDFMKNKRTDIVSLNHNGKRAEGAFMFESFLYSNAHTLNYPELKGLEPGSWVVSYKIESDSIWKEIQEGKINGFSPEIDAFIDDQNSLNELCKIKEAIEIIELLTIN